MGTRIEIDAIGAVNGIQIESRGKAEVVDGQVEIELFADRTPFHWDHALLVPLVYGMIAVGGKDEPMALIRAWQVLLDENGRGTGKVSATASMASEETEERRLRMEFQAKSLIEPIERITEFEVPVRAVVDNSLANSWAFTTSFGNGYQVLGTTWVLNAEEGGLAGRVADVRRVALRREGQLIRVTTGYE